MLRSDFDHQLFQEGRMALFDPNLPLDDQVDLLPYDEKWEFPNEKLKLGKIYFVCYINNKRLRVMIIV